MATLAVQTITRAGVVPTANAAAGGGDKFPNTGVEFLIIKNGDSGSHTVTIPLPILVDGEAVSSRTVVIAAGVEKVIGPFPTSQYNDTGGFVNLTYDAVTAVTVKVLAPGS